MGRNVLGMFVVVAAIAVACGGRVTGNCQLCGQACVDTTSDIYNCGGCGQPCAVGQSCVAGKCLYSDGTSPTSPTTCKDPSLYDCGDGHCTDFVSDPQNCGGCGIDCGGGACSNGVCTTADCVVDGASCASDADCCSALCTIDGVCGCIATGAGGCGVDSDCCSPSVICTDNGVCQ